MRFSIMSRRLLHIAKGLDMAAWKARTALYVSVSQITCEILGLLRNIILARLLGPSEMGVFATLAITLSLLDMVSDLGPDRLLVQAEDGDREEFQATAQTLLLIRGALCGTLLVCLAIPVAGLFGNPSLAWMIAALGAIAGIRGWLHLDCKRAQRHREFRGSIIVELASAGLTTAAVVVFAKHVHNASAFVWISLLQVIVLVIASHLVATRRYRLAYQPEIAGRLFRFGWPLAGNSLIMFGALQGDRLVVLASATAADLGRYAVAFQLTMVPTLLISRIMSTIWLPELARDQSDPERFSNRVNQLSSMLGLISLGFTLAVMWTGNFALGLLYGNAFQVTPSLIGWLATMQGLRILRTVPSLTAMARADSLNPLASNVFRLTGIVAAAAVGLSGWGLEAIAAAGCGGEVVALIGSIYLLQFRHSIQPTAIWTATTLFSAGTICAWGSLSGSDSIVIRSGLVGLAGVVLMLSVLHVVWANRSRADLVSEVSVKPRCMIAEKGI
jgi:O-antigen/teichoic acid export membrane protein